MILHILLIVMIIYLECKFFVAKLISNSNNNLQSQNFFSFLKILLKNTQVILHRHMVSIHVFY